MKQLICSAVVLLWMASTAVNSYGQNTRSKNMSVQQVKSAIAGWPAKPKEVAEKMFSKYGAPDEMTSSVLVWHNNGPWKKTILYKEEIPHNFPKAHTDLLQQFLDYKTPLDKYNDLAAFDGSVIVERTKGQMSARCDKEEMNFLALNLANDVATGKKTVEEARAYYAKAAMEFMQGNKDPYVQSLTFPTQHGGTMDPDQPAKM